MEELKQRHIAKLQKEMEVKASCGEGAQELVEALLIEHPSAGEAMSAGFKTQYRAICMNIRNVSAMLNEKSATVDEISRMSGKAMASKEVKKQVEAIKEEEIKADTLLEGYSAKCRICGLRKMSMSNTNVMADLEERCK
eukprot:TRINITY_DN10911_c0_g1_i2.p1 TRINITY_DN10911_c0_g1~~TRINITY_DN10911_c0_g1_i2.p1  ORF type:complete len:139 (+),score=29.08 TRINITY_DN10911_c0_g1_i2:53-469(+)